MNLNMPNQAEFTRHAIVDQQQQGIVSGTFDHPASWQAESRVFWNYQHTSLPAAAYSRVVSPENSAMLEFLPMESFSWTEPETGFYARGQNVGGAVNLPPMSGVDALIQLVIPKYRGDRQGLRIIETNAEPAAVNPPPQVQNAFAHKVCVKIEYSENGRIFEEEFHAKHVVSQFPPMNSGWGMTYFTGWSLTDFCCFRAERGQFDALREIFLKIHASLEINPQWVSLVNRVSQMLLQNSKQMADESIQGGWEMLRMNGQRIQETATRNQAYIDGQWDRINNSYNTPPPVSSTSTAKESEYTSHEAFIDTVREEESIYNPENTANEKVSGHHDHIWKDEFGNTFGTNDPNYDPNRDSNRNWTEARKKRIGD